MARATAAAAARTAAAILDAATALFARQGYAAVALEDVAEAAGVTRGAVYHHYRSKAGLFRAVAAQVQSGVAAAVLRAAEKAGADPRAQLRAGSHAFLEASTAAPAVRILLIDGPAVVGWQEWRRLDAESSVVHLRAVLAETGVSEELLDAATAQLSGAMNEAALWIAEHPDQSRARVRAHSVLDRLVAAVLG